MLLTATVRDFFCLWAAGEYLIQHLEHLLSLLLLWCRIVSHTFFHHSLHFLCSILPFLEYFFLRDTTSSVDGLTLTAVGLLKRWLELAVSSTEQPLTFSGRQHSWSPPHWQIWQPTPNRVNKVCVFISAQEFSHSCFFPIISSVPLKDRDLLSSLLWLWLLAKTNLPRSGKHFSK